MEQERWDAFRCRAVLGVLIRPVDVDIPVFDTAVIHAEEAALEALRQKAIMPEKTVEMP